MKLRLILLAVLFVFICLGTSFAAITIENRTGGIKIIMPDGKQLVIQQGDPLPIIPDGASIVILTGSATVITSGKSTVSVSIGAYTAKLIEESKIILILNPDGTVTSTIISGEALITRKAEAYRGNRPPPGLELGASENRERIDISPSG